MGGQGIMSIFFYKGYELDSNGDSGRPEVEVVDLRMEVPGPDGRHGHTVYRTTSLDEAIKWVDGYIAGYQWAVEARIVQFVEGLDRA